MEYRDGIRVPFCMFELLLGLISHFLLVNCNFLTKQYPFRLENRRAIFLPYILQITSLDCELFTLAENVGTGTRGN